VGQGPAPGSCQATGPSSARTCRLFAAGLVAATASRGPSPPSCPRKDRRGRGKKDARPVRDLVPFAPRSAAPPLLAGLLVVLVPLRVCENSGPLDLALEAPQCAVQRFVLADPHLGQEATSSVNGCARCRHYTRGATRSATGAPSVLTGDHYGRKHSRRGSASRLSSRPSLQAQSEHGG